MIRRAPINWVIYAMSLIGLLACGLFCNRLGEASRDFPESSRDALLVLLAVSACAASFELFASKLRWYRVALSVRLCSFLLISRIVAGVPAAEMVLLCGLVAEIAAYERYPQNLLVGSGVLFLVLAVRQAAFMGDLQLSFIAALTRQIDYAFVGLFLVAPSCLATRYREDLIGVRREKGLLDEAAVKLTTLNLQYQDYATSAAEAAMEDERKRLTRDIHDVVGYTLTNNIAMMEAATDMMRRNPFGIPALIKAARENAQEGLDLIREALYKLRGAESPEPTGLRAISRMCRIFEKATGIRVALAYGNAAGTYGEAVNSAIYHLVQEALINSFRHGRARNVTVSLFDVGEAIAVSIGDDGAGARDFVEGIGLRGMRERIAQLGGGLTVNGALGGFSIRARIPLRGSD
jgi:signal transduction histidine kinase